MAAEKRQPWMKWYPADWRADPTLRMCTLVARGVWIELLGFMHEAEPYGHLVIAGTVPTDQQLSVLIGATPAVVKRAIAELEEHGVFSRTEDGVIYSRRMVRDKAQAERDRENGKGGGNPKLRTTVNRIDNRGVNPPDKAQMLEARCQMLEEPSPTTEPSPEKPKLKAASAAKKYAFEGRIVRLTEPDFERWKAVFHAIPDLVAELTAIDAKFLETRPKNWFSQCSAWLRSKHERILVERAKSAETPPATADPANQPRQGEPGWKSPVDGWIPGQL